MPGPRDRLAAPLAAALLVLVTLRTLPFLVESHREPPVDPATGLELVFGGFAYVPKDLAAYMGFIEQTRRQGTFLYENPFTTDPQHGRFVLAFFFATGLLARLGGLSSPAAFEAMRYVAGGLLGWALWVWLAGRGLDGRRRAYAWLMVLTSAGIAWIGWLLPQPVPSITLRRFWEMYGWSTFESLFNPMWVLSMALVLLGQRWLGDWLAAAAPRTRSLAGVAAVHCLLLITHSYSFMLSLAALGLALALRAARSPGDLRTRRLLAPGALAAALAATAVALGTWQSRDPVFAAGSRQALAVQQTLPVHLWPIGFGLVLLLAVLGARARGWFAGRPPAGDETWQGWILAEMVLCTVPLLSGYKVLYLAHPPLAALAGVGVLDAAERARRPLLPWLVLALAAIGTGFTVARSLETPRARLGDYYLYAADRQVLDGLADLPDGAVLADPQLARYVPGLAAKKVFAGQWFLTPESAARADDVRAFYAAETGDAWKRRLLQEHGIRYVVWGVRDGSPAPATVAALSLVQVAASADGRAQAFRFTPPSSR